MFGNIKNWQQIYRANKARKQADADTATIKTARRFDSYASGDDTSLNSLLSNQGGYVKDVSMVKAQQAFNNRPQATKRIQNTYQGYGYK